MARTAEIPEEGSGTVHQDLSNSFTQPAAEGFCVELEKAQAEIDDIMAEAVAQCQPLKDHIKDIRKRAAEAGFEKKAMDANMRKRRHLRKAEQVTDSLNDDQKEKFAQIELFLEAVPL